MPPEIILLDKEKLKRQTGLLTFAASGEPTNSLDHLNGGSPAKRSSIREDDRREKAIVLKGWP
jgi:hypothetical protein